MGRTSELFCHPVRFGIIALTSMLVILPRKGTHCWSYCGRRARLQMIPPSSLVLSPQGMVWIYPLLRTSTEHILIVRGL